MEGNIGFDNRPNIVEINNIDQVILKITTDKIRINLMKIKKILRYQTSFHTPLSVVVSFGLSLYATSFNENKLGINAQTWQAIFFILLLAGFVWLFISVANYLKNVKKANDKYLLNLFLTKES